MRESYNKNPRSSSSCSWDEACSEAHRRLTFALMRTEKNTKGDAPTCLSKTPSNSAKKSKKKSSFLLNLWKLLPLQKGLSFKP